MSDSTLKQPDEFIAKVEHLLSECAQWATDRHLQTRSGTLALNEERYAPYQIATLEILAPDGQLIAELRPVGASIIGANGRVDLMGTLDTAILVNWNAGGPSITTTIDAGGPISTTTQYLYKGIDSDGWYWVESRRLGRAHRLDAALFYDLLQGVSDCAPID